MATIYYIYILYSSIADKYYVGYSDDPHRRLTEHNTMFINAVSSEYRPWALKAIFQCGPIEADAIKMEHFIKKQKSRAFIEKLIDTGFMSPDLLSPLIRVPHTGQ